jgi:hypothetical protein
MSISAVMANKYRQQKLPVIFQQVIMIQHENTSKYKNLRLIKWVNLTLVCGENEDTLNGISKLKCLCRLVQDGKGWLHDQQAMCTLRSC